jgi:hypothetical protein
MLRIPTRSQQARLLNAAALFAHTRFCGIVKLYRLTYLLDIMHLQRTGVTVTGQTYLAYSFGPEPNYLSSLFERGHPRAALSEVLAVRTDESIDVFNRVLLPKQPPIPTDFTPQQVDLANSLFERYRESHWAEVDLNSDNGAYAATWAQGRGHGRVIDMARTISLDDPHSEYALERYREDQLHLRTLHSHLGDTA